MAHAAKINSDNIVEQVIVIPDGLGDGAEDDASVQAYINGIGLPGTWVRTSYNASIRGKYAGVGDRYDAERDEFVSPVVEETPA
jgi:hypothetical protein